ncbi:MAG: hypothetical protein EHM23_13855 [Acidobacteria bacterium]|nr:MAG: hypothetical protein EHM23_13855 [Acidobacteriota bacterium]
MTGNVTRSFGFVGDVSRQSQTLTFLGNELGNGSIYLLLFGPQFSFRSGRFHGFGRGLFGTSHNTVPARTVDAWALAYGFGGGLDLGVSSGFALRLLQWDVITRDLERGSRTSHRLSFGGVVRF